MSTTRHLVNRQRRLATVAAAERTTAPLRRKGRAGEDEQQSVVTPDLEESSDPRDADQTEEEEEEDEARGEQPRTMLRPRIRLPVVLCALTVLLGAFAAWSFTAADGLRGDASRRNTALTDIGRTSEVKGQISEAVGAVFSYNYATTAKSEQAARTYLVGKAVQQHKDMLAEVRAQAPKQKLVLTTTVTESGVELLDGDRARLLIFADQSNTRTGKSDETTYAAAMFAVDAVRRGGTWRISAIDTFTQ
ncbi:hypothetical protein [Streptomyces atratus]|uniref:Mce-associated membrane protein n=1 Tax=Streptomyces atratus TaxID=1893 RepID=A0A2Z5JMC9_STRAR|nr:hypothetical protein [Streptomyces atratus]AXE81384.1 hypothetical protein C5746_35555 [Streptomyces atratus]